MLNEITSIHFMKKSFQLAIFHTKSIFNEKLQIMCSKHHFYGKIVFHAHSDEFANKVCVSNFFFIDNRIKIVINKRNHESFEFKGQLD